MPKLTSQLINKADIKSHTCAKSNTAIFQVAIKSDLIQIRTENTEFPKIITTKKSATQAHCKYVLQPTFL